MLFLYYTNAVKIFILILLMTATIEVYDVFDELSVTVQSF